METLFNLLLLLLALLFLVHYLNDIRELRRIASWPQTPGELSHCHLQDDNKKYRLSVQYQYHVADQTYVSDVIQSPYDAEPFFSKKLRYFYYRLVRAFENREEITVFYDPNDPNQAVLYRSRSKKLYVYTLVFLVIIITHALLMLNWI